MPVIIILLLIIVILIGGGPALLFGGIAALFALFGPLQGVLWFGIVLGGLLAVAGLFAFIGGLLDPSSRPNTNPQNCTNCGHPRTSDLTYCFKCSHKHSTRYTGN